MTPFEIRTRYSGPTNTRGSRIVAYGLGRQLTISYDYSANDTHLVAVEALLRSTGRDPGAFTVSLTRQTRTGYVWRVA